MNDTDGETPSQGDEFNNLINKQHYEDVMPFMKSINDHEEYSDPKNTLELKTLKPGQELTLEFYPSPENPEPEPIIINITEVVSSHIKGIARGGPEKWEAMEVGLGLSTFADSGSLAKGGVVEPGLYPELHFTDEKLKAEQAELIRKIYSENHLIFIQGARIDDKYFDEYRTDLNVPTTEDRINWMMDLAHIGHRAYTPGMLADWKVEIPQIVDPNVIKFGQGTSGK